MVRVCTIEGCGKKPLARGWCSAHYARWWNHGSPTAGGLSKEEPLRFLKEVVLPYQGEECLIWPFDRGGNGYARIGIGYKRFMVQRIVCEKQDGPPPTPGHEAAHSCGKGHEGCVSGKHLRWATVSENQMDRVEHGNSNRGSRHGLSRLKENDVVSIRARLEMGEAQSKIAADFPVSQATISRIKTGECWGWLNDQNQ